VLVGPAIIGLFEEASSAFEIPWPLFVCLGVPFGTLHGEEVASVHMEGHRKVATGVGDRMDCVVAENQDFTSSELPTAGCFEATRDAAEVGVVLLAAVHPNGCPHPMLVRVEGHSRCPRHVQHGQIVGAVQGLDAAGIYGSEGLHESGGIRDELVKNIADGQHRRVFGQCSLTSSDDLFDRKQHLSRLRRLCRAVPITRNGCTGSSSKTLGCMTRVRTEARESDMEGDNTDSAEASVRSRSDHAVLDTFNLGFPWTVFDPFIVAVHHVDHYPAGNPEMGPATSDGQRDVDADPSTPGWGMYYGRVVPGFPQHPHRGFETVTFVRKGAVDHSDTLGAAARYGVGDVQWLTAGRGIQHAEMFPLRGQDGPNTLDLFQIWLNLPGADKMVEPYFTMLWREEMPGTVLKDDAGHSTEVTVVAGAFEGIQPLPAPPDSWASKEEGEVAIWQFLAEPGSEWTLPPTVQSETVRTLYVFEGSVEVDGEAMEAPIGAVLRSDRPVVVSAGSGGSQVIILQGRPIGEPVAMGGPFVMNTQQEIEEAFRDYHSTGFGAWPWEAADPVHSRSTPRFARHPDGRTENPEEDDL
jgi:redox-sensitive bicupin YhaK (pirin superfamily)